MCRSETDEVKPQKKVSKVAVVVGPPVREEKGTRPNGINLSVTKTTVMACEIEPDAPKFRRFHDSQEKRKGRLGQGFRRAIRGFRNCRTGRCLRFG